MPPKKSKVEKQRQKLTEKTFEDLWDSDSSYQFLRSPSKKTANIENHDFSQPIEEIQQDIFLVHNYTPVTDDPVMSVLTDVSNETVVAKYGKRKRISTNDICKRIKITDTVIEETPASSIASGTKTFYCSQNLYETVTKDNPDIMQSIVPSFTCAKSASYSQLRISECPTSAATDDDDKTLSGLDLSTAAKNNHGQSYVSEHFVSQDQAVVAADNVVEDLANNEKSMQNQGYIMSQLYNSQEQESSQQNAPPFNQVSNQEYIMTQLYDSNSFVQQNKQSLSSAPHQNTVANSNIVNILQTPQHCANGGFLSTNIGYQEKSLESNASDQSSVLSGNKSQNMGDGQASPNLSNSHNGRGKNESFDTVVQTYYSGDMFADENAQSAGRLWQTKAFYKKNNLSLGNCSPSSDVHLSLINNPPAEFILRKGADILNQEAERLNKGNKSISDFNDNTESASRQLFQFQNSNGSFSLTPEDTAGADPLILPPTLLLSNYCSEYDKAYTMRDLKPNQYRNYRHNESLRSLKEHLDTIIPPNKSLRDFYKMKNLP